MCVVRQKEGPAPRATPRMTSMKSFGSLVSLAEKDRRRVQVMTWQLGAVEGSKHPDRADAEPV